jgi:hypothetical protein
MASHTEEKRFELILVSPLTADTGLLPIQRHASMWLATSFENSAARASRRIIIQVLISFAQRHWGAE